MKIPLPKIPLPKIPLPNNDVILPLPVGREYLLCRLLLRKFAGVPGGPLKR